MAKQNKELAQEFHFSLEEKRDEYEKGFRIDELFPLNTSETKTYNNQSLSIVFTIQKSSVGLRYAFVSKLFTDINSISPETGENLIIFPLYCYPKTDTQQTTALHSPRLESQSRNFGSSEKTRIPNLNPEIVQQIAENLGLSFVPEKESEGKVCYINNPEVRDDFKTTFAPIDLLNYIYAVLHSPNYQEKYKEFAKENFPKIPFPKPDTFWQLAKLGGELRQTLTETESLLKEIDKIGIE